MVKYNSPPKVIRRFQFGYQSLKIYNVPPQRFQNFQCCHSILLAFFLQTRRNRRHVLCTWFFRCKHLNFTLTPKRCRLCCSISSQKHPKLRSVRSTHRAFHGQLQQPRCGLITRRFLNSLSSPFKANRKSQSSAPKTPSTNLIVGLVKILRKHRKERNGVEPLHRH
jgi:hypothetical protein